MYDALNLDFDNNDECGTVTYFKRLNQRDQRLESWGVPLLHTVRHALLTILLLLSIYGVWSAWLIPSFKFLVPLRLFFCEGKAPVPLFFVGFIVYGTVCGFLALAVVRLADRILNRHKKELFEAEERIALNKSSDLWQELETVISGNLRLRRYAVADFYSKQLLELSERYVTVPARISRWLMSTDCWVSIAEHNQSWRSKLISPFRAKGILSLTADTIYFDSRQISFKVCLRDIKSLGLSLQPYGLKSIMPRLIVMSFNEAGIERTVYLLPSCFWLPLVDELNKLVNKWYMYIYNADARRRRKEKGDYTVRPSALADASTFRAISVQTK